ncbi:Iq-domain [Thalictrum thalictroides]|uniref:Iq-domain n=1 Tax=Thalictrum thalictroides TaxID=46969 RepID=A0A7J6VL02_THATH|nr:Iq-domain [Thalictrum thalictroides]
MAKMTWLNQLKKVFVSEPKANADKKEKKRRRVIARFKWKCLPALAAPSAHKKSFNEAEKEHSKHAMNAAIATAAAAEAAVASAEAAVEVVRLAGIPCPRLFLKYKKRSRPLAAIKIQTAFRGYLARKALRALKGVVRLQAMIRGQAVRRQVINTLNGLQTLVKIQSQFRLTEKVVGDKQFMKAAYELGERRTVQIKQPELLNRQRSWVHTLPAEEDIDALFLSRHQAFIERERVKEYLSSRQERRNSKAYEEHDGVSVYGSQGHWLEQWVDAQERKRRMSETSDLVAFSIPDQEFAEGRPGLKLGSLKYHEAIAGRSSPINLPRRSFERPIRSSFEDIDSLGSPVVPNYMSPTESAKARSRSISLPKQTAGSTELYSDHGSPSKSRRTFSSINSDSSINAVKGGKVPISQQKSPSLKVPIGPIKSYQTAKDLSIDSESSYLNWAQRIDLR